jgi:hypothetical protein
MQAGFQVMDQVIPVVPAFVIVIRVEAVVSIGIYVVRIIGRRECMLCPIAQHHNQPANYKWENEDHQRCLQIDETQNGDYNIIGDFSPGKGNIILRPAAFEEVPKQLRKSNGEKPEKVSQEIPQIIPLIVKCAAFVIGIVVFYMVHANVVTDIAFGGMAKKRRHKPGDIVIKPIVLLFEKRTVRYLVIKQTKRTPQPDA